MGLWRRLLEKIFKDHALQGKEDVLTEEEIEGYSFCSESKEKCATDCSSTVSMPTIAGTN